MTEEIITDTIRSVSQRREQITILIAHRLSTILHADEIMVLEKGRITETGHTSSLAKRELYYAMWRQQIGERLKSKLEHGGKTSWMSSQWMQRREEAKKNLR